MIAQVGITGFTASRLWKKLDEKYSSLLGVSRSRLKDSRILVGDFTKLESKLSEIDTLIYTLSPYFDQVPSLIEFLKRNQFQGHLLIFSSAAIYTSIPIQKRQWIYDAEQAALQAPFLCTVIRPNLIYGFPGDGNFERLITWVKRLPLIPLIGNGSNLIQPIHVDDLVDAVLGMIEKKPKGIVELAGPRAVTYREFLESIFKALGSAKLIIPFPKFIIKQFFLAKRFIFPLDLKTKFVRWDQLERFSESRALAHSRTEEFVSRPLKGLAEGIDQEVKSLQKKELKYDP